MKKNKNILLFIALVFALSITYWFEEKGTLKRTLTEAHDAEILNADNLGDLKNVIGIKLNFEKKGDQYFTKDSKVLLSKSRLDEFFKILSGLKVKTFLNDADVNKVGRGFYIGDDALKLTFSFEKGSIAFTLGKKLSFDQTFYMEIEKAGKKQMVIAKDVSPDPGVYQNDKDYQRSDALYQRLQVLFMLTNLYFYDTRIFKDLYLDPKSINFKEISISTFRNKKFKINFENTSTSPEVPKGLNYNEDNWISFHQTLSTLEAKAGVMPYEPSVLLEVLSQLDIVDRNGRNIILTVYKKFGEQNGYFLTSNLDKMLYVLKPTDARYFFVNVQDFWKKNLGPKSNEYQMSLSFYDNKSEEVKIIDKELFKANAIKPGLTTRPMEFKKLIDFLKIEGDHVSELTEKPSEILKKNIMRVHFENRDLSVMLEDNDVVLVDLNLRLKIHHYVGANIPFSIKRTDYFQ